jgi:hypothetical protein
MEKTWINGQWKPKVWNYFNHIGKKTTNDLENFNKQANASINQKNPNIFKFCNFLKRVDGSMTQQVHSYRENPTVNNKPIYSKKIVAKEKMDLSNKEAYINGEISLKDYLYAAAANIEYIEYPDPDADEPDPEPEQSQQLSADSNQQSQLSDTTILTTINNQHQPQQIPPDNYQQEAFENVFSRYTDQLVAISRPLEDIDIDIDYSIHQSSGSISESFFGRL